MNINRNYLNLTLILFGIGFVLTFSSLYILNTYLGKNLYLGELPELLANDFTRVYYFTKHGLSYDYVRNYFPSEPLPYGSLTLIIFKIFSFLPIQISVILFYFIFIVGLLAIHYTLIKNSNYTKLNKIFAIITLSFASCPVIYILDRGNFDMLIYVTLVYAVLNYDKGKTKTFVTLISTVAASKFFPVVFGLLLLRDKKWKMILLATVITIFLFFAPFFLFQNDFFYNLKGFLFEIKDSKRYFNLMNISFSYTFKKIIFLFVSKDELSIHWKTFYLYYNVFIILLGIALSFIITFSKRIQKWEIISLISLYAVLFPHMSAGYKLMIALIPMYYMLQEKSTLELNIIVPVYVFSISLIPAFINLLAKGFHVWIALTVFFTIIFFYLLLKHIFIHLFFYVRSKNN